MKFILGIDYFLFFLEFPHMGVPGAVALNTDGTSNIYINTLYRADIQARTVKHELRHFVKGHFSCDWKTIEEKELEADDVDDPSCVFADDFSWVEYTEQTEDIVISRVLPGAQSSISVFRSSALPEWATFGFYVPDNSMKPHFKKDQLLCCDSQQLRSGDVGLFKYQGDTILRQYHKDIFGMTYLFTLGKTRNCTLLRPEEERNLLCLGRIHTEKRIPLPGL